MIFVHDYINIKPLKYMTREEVNLLVNLHKKFDEDVERVASKMSLYDKDYLDVEHWWIDEGSVCGRGEVYALNCHVDTVYVCFDIELLSYTDEELNVYVDELIRKKEEEEMEKKIKQEKDEKQRDFQLYNALKEKLGL